VRSSGPGSASVRPAEERKAHRRGHDPVVLPGPARPGSRLVCRLHARQRICREEDRQVPFPCRKAGLRGLQGSLLQPRDERRDKGDHEVRRSTDDLSPSRSRADAHPGRCARTKPWITVSRAPGKPVSTGGCSFSSCCSSAAASSFPRLLPSFPCTSVTSATPLPSLPAHSRSSAWSAWSLPWQEARSAIFSDESRPWCSGWPVSWRRAPHSSQGHRRPSCSWARCTGQG
jgi:hypothetical protein